MSLRVRRASTGSPPRRTVHRVSPSAPREGRRAVRSFALPALTALALGAAIVEGRAVIALVAPATLGILLLLLLHHFLRDPDGTPDTEARVLRWTMVAFASHLLFGLVITYTPSALAYLGGDAYGYHIFAKWIVEFGVGSLAEKLPAGKEGYYYFLAGVYKVFGAYPAAGLALNAAMSAALVPLTRDSTRRLFGPMAAANAAPIVVLLPSVFLFSSQLLKEAPILFLFSVAANAALRVLDRVSLSATLVTVVSLALLLTLRAPVALVGGAGLLLGIALGRRQVLSGFTTGLATLAMLAVMITTVGVGSAGVQSTLEKSTLEESNRQRTGLAYESSTAFGSDVDTGTPRKALAYLPVALAHFFLGPFPWQIGGLRQLPALVDVLALWFLWPSLFRGVSSAMRRQGRRVAVLVLPALAMACVLSLAVGNFGVLMRERMQVLILLVPFMAYGMAVKAAAKNIQTSPAPLAVPA